MAVTWETKIVSLYIRLRGPKPLCFIYSEIDPIRRDILALIPGTLVRSKNLQMSSLDLVDGSYVRVFAVNNRHTFDH